MTNPKVRVAVINMYAGGEAIDLSAADEMIIVDEPWETTVIQQVENRIQNLAKAQQLTIYRLRAEGTVEEDIAGMTDAQREALMRGEPRALEHLIELRNERLEEAA
jgi:SNF2 family DNA or RNA helicase